LKFQTAFRLEIDRAIELGMIARSNKSCRLKTFMESVLRVKFQHDRPFIKDIRHYFIVNQSSNLILKVKALLGKS
jgi:site-specific recombinase, phage integrase family